MKTFQKRKNISKIILNFEVFKKTTKMKTQKNRATLAQKLQLFVKEKTFFNCYTALT